MTTEEKRRKHTEYMRLYRQRPEAQKRTRKWWRAYRQRPERKEYMRLYALRAARKDWQRAYSHRPEIRQRINANRRAWDQTQKAKALRAEYRDKNRPRLRKVHKLWRDAHPIARRENKRRTRVSAKANMFAQLISAVANLKCAICGKRMPFKDRTIDHVIPLSKGGTGDSWNLQIVHMRCNQKKGCRVPDELNFAQLQQ